MEMLRISNAVVDVDYVSVSYDDNAKDEHRAVTRDVARIRRLYPAFTDEAYKKVSRYGYRGHLVGQSFIGRNTALRCLEVHTGEPARDFALPAEARMATAVVNRIDFSADLFIENICSRKRQLQMSTA